MEQEAAAAPEPVAVGPVTVAFVAAGVSLDVLADGGRAPAGDEGSRPAGDGRRARRPAARGYRFGRPARDPLRPDPLRVLIVRGAAGGLALGLAMLLGLAAPAHPRRGTSGATFGPTRLAPALARSLAPAATCRSSTRASPTGTPWTWTRSGTTTRATRTPSSRPATASLRAAPTPARSRPTASSTGGGPMRRSGSRSRAACPEFRGSRPRASGSRARPGSATLGSRPATTTAWRLTPA